MIEIRSERQLYQLFEISSIGLVRSAENPADGVSKINHNGALHGLLDMQVDDKEAIK